MNKYLCGVFIDEYKIVGLPGFDDTSKYMEIGYKMNQLLFNKKNIMFTSAL